MLASASLTWKYSANTPSLMLANFHPPSALPDCEECPACEAASPHSGVIAPTKTWSPGLKRFTALPTWWTRPTASCPRVRFSRGPIAPFTVCTSEVQMRALVVLTTASVGPGLGIGLSAKPTLPIPFITKARIAVDLHCASSHGAQSRNVKCAPQVSNVKDEKDGCCAIARVESDAALRTRATVDRFCRPR